MLKLNVNEIIIHAEQIQLVHDEDGQLVARCHSMRSYDQAITSKEPENKHINNTLVVVGAATVFCRDITIPLNGLWSLTEVKD